MQSVKESSAAALSAVEFIFLDNPELKKYIHNFTKIDAIIIASESVENAVLSSGVIIFSIELLKGLQRKFPSLPHTHNDRDRTDALCRRDGLQA